MPERVRPTTVGRLVPLLLMPAGAFAVHQLRYLLAYGGQAGLELARQGHSYLHSVVPWIVLLLGIAAGLFVRALGRAFAGHTSLPRYTFSLAVLWVSSSVALLTIYASQEFLEGLFATGHPAGLSGVFAYGGWWSVPAAVCVGFVLAAASHGALWVLREVVARCSARAVRQSPRPRVRRRRLVHLALRRVAPLAPGWSGRGPPRSLRA
jgi:hypothetical protein